MPIAQDTRNLQVASGTNYASADAGPFSDLLKFELRHPAMPRTVKGKLFIKDVIGLTGMQISLNCLPPGAVVPSTHQHKTNEEVYLFIKGSGEMWIDGEIVPVSEGSVVRIGTKGVRTWRNNSKEELHYIVIQAKEGSLDADTFEDGIPGDAAVWP